MLYGSYTSGKIHASSDIDIAIISPDFGKDRFEEGKLLMQIAWRVDPRIEAVPISSEFYEKDTCIPLIDEIRRKGIMVGQDILKKLKIKKTGKINSSHVVEI